MFLSRITKSVRGADYSYWHLCQTFRTARGPRRRIVASLGKLDASQCASLRGSWDDLPALLRGELPAAKPRASRIPSASLPGFDSSGGGGGCAAADQQRPHCAPPRRGWELGDIGDVSVERCREFGVCYLALALWHRLGLDRLLAALLPRGREALDWAGAAALLAVARFCAQPSELGVAEHWFGSTALDDLLGIDGSRVNDARLYRALDHVGKHKDALCSHLMARYRDWFGVRMEFLL